MEPLILEDAEDVSSMSLFYLIARRVHDIALPL